ncbi:MAG: class I SAM-dependent methyltransferase [Burkholderiales bacterium]|jgi:hypothetical protein|nr:class I SAM-dependent methyltransferase [Burkholderiales bacterium]
MDNKTFSPAEQTLFDARFEAQKIAFGPAVFMCAHYAWKEGILEALSLAGKTGLTLDETQAATRKNKYAIKIVLESCLSAGMVSLVNQRYVLDKVGYCILSDKITQINFDFIHDVCYEGFCELKASLDQEKPIGLKRLGDWKTIYEGLCELPEPAQQSWLHFDHYYSDTSFPLILPEVFSNQPKHIMDIGANTGKFSLAALAHHPDVFLHLVDLPLQLNRAQEALTAAHVVDRAAFYPRDFLDVHASFPNNMDLIWMSQLLSCFSEDAIASILRRAASSLSPNGNILIMDTFWDQQQFDIAAYCLINTSPYFTAMASGNSKVYESEDYIRLCRQVGLELIGIKKHIGFCHSLLRFKKSG